MIRKVSINRRTVGQRMQQDFLRMVRAQQSLLWVSQKFANDQVPVE